MTDDHPSSSPTRASILPSDVESLMREFLIISDEELGALSRLRGLSLTVEEMKTIQNHFRTMGRAPTPAELETLAQTWSEHCKHKTFRAAIEHVEVDDQGREQKRSYTDLLKDTVVKVTTELAKPWCLSVFKDNAGIISVTPQDAVAFKVETHNHPSALEPYGGAGTGLGGVIRDILGAGLGAKPIANTDVFCFGPVHAGEGPDGADPKTSTGLTTRRIVQGVVSGVRDYGNRMGIPTVNGAVYFDDDFRENPLVFCGTLGLIPVSKIHKDVHPGDRVVMAGGRVGRDGIHGATFSSDSLTTGIPSSVVQIGNPIVQKKLMDVLLVARDQGLYRGITDCGAGGLSSAVGEMGEKTGVDVQLEKVPLKYDGLVPWEIWLSESQERMVLAVPPENMAALQKLFEGEDVELADIGVFTGDGRLKVRHGSTVLVDMDMAFLHDGLPRRKMTSRWVAPAYVPFPESPLGAKPLNLKKALLDILAQPTVASKERIIRQYDHEVQGRTVMKPLVGTRGQGPSDAAVLQLSPHSLRGVALSCGLNPHWSRWDPYWMAAAAIDEAIRNLVAVGAPLDRVAILDNFCGGNPTQPAILGELVRAAQACYDVAKEYGTPFISGKDSLFNEFVDPRHGSRRSIPTTLLISAVAIVNDVSRLISMDLKKPGNLLYIVGLTKDEMGGSRYGLWRESRGGVVPRLDPAKNWILYKKLSAALSRGLAVSCHDLSDGGLGVALAEMAFAGECGAVVDLTRVPMETSLIAQGRSDKVLFSESNARFIVEVPSRSRSAFESALRGQPTAPIGTVQKKSTLQISGYNGKKWFWPLKDLERAWRGGLKYL